VTLAAAWVVFPIVALALYGGCGLLLDQATGGRLPGLLIAPAGYALAIVAASLTTISSRTAQATTPLVVALAVAGVGLSLRQRRRPDAGAVVTALAVFAAYAAPIVLSGSATFAGYITLDDTSTWLALADNALVHGRAVSELPPSTYQTVLHDYLTVGGYPIGAFLPLGIGHELTRQDAAWLFQPQLAFMAAMLGLVLYALAGELVRSRALRAVAAVLGAQAALLYGYSFWSGIKEMTSALLIALIVALVSRLLRSGSRLRDTIPLAVAAAALADVLSVVGVVWFGALGIVVVGLLFSSHRRQTVASVLLATAVALVLALPALLLARTFVGAATGDALTEGGTAGLGNLLHPLSYLQVLGIWPTGDFRQRPQEMTSVRLLLAIVVAGCALALVESVRRRKWGMGLLLAVSGIGALAVVVLGGLGHGSPWLDGKALGTASPAFVTAALTGFAVVVEGRGRVLALVGAAAGIAVVGGVLWSNALAYANVWLAPRAQLDELETIGKTFAGDGPTLMTEYQPFGVRHFLRAMDPEGASERRARPVFLRAGGDLDKGQYADLDDFQLASILVYRTLVLRVSPVESRPPSVYQPVWEGRYYEVWQRPEGPDSILEHLSLGSTDDPDAPAPCSDVRSAAAVAAARDGTLVASVRAAPIVVLLGAASRPASWSVAQDGTLVPSGGGTATVTVRVPSAGVYRAYLGGSFRDTVAITVDGRPAGTRTGQLSESGQYVAFDSIRLGAGTHTVRISYSRDRLLPGRGSYSFGIGPLALGQPATDSRLLVVPPARATSLCGRDLDWIEAVAGSANP
jgi:hypothetical protein